MGAAMAKDGALTYLLNKMVLRLDENEKRGNKNGYFVGDSLTIADLAVLGSCSSLISGYFDHIPKDLYTKNHPKLAAFLERMRLSRHLMQSMNSVKLIIRMMQKRKESKW